MLPHVRDFVALEEWDVQKHIPPNYGSSSTEIYENEREGCAG